MRAPYHTRRLRRDSGTGELIAKIKPSKSFRIRSVEKHVGKIFSKLGLLPSDADHRRVLAVLRYPEP
jgi:hypothetical protein